VSHQVPRRPLPRRPRRPIMTRRRESGASLPGSRMAAVPDRVDVVLVADVGDPHQLCVDAQLQALGARTLRLNLSDFVSRTLVSRIGALDVAEGTNWSRVDHATTVWWFRPGQAHVEEGTAADEAQLIADEAPAVLIGSFRAAGVRWVDDPDVIRRAEWKLSECLINDPMAPWSWGGARLVPWRVC
jgi:hypothetical protein